MGNVGGAHIGIAVDGERLRRELGLRAISSRDFAAEAGVSPRTVVRAAKGERVVPRVMRKMAEALARIPPVAGTQLLVAGVPRRRGRPPKTNATAAAVLVTRSEARPGG
jgi:transcriptional regulator with XRE-family HTH domain